MAQSEIYTDGGGYDGKSSSAFAVYQDGVMIAKHHCQQPGTNNVGELTAMINAFRYIIATDINSCDIYTDSMYVKGILDGWSINSNQELWASAMELYKQIKTKVKVHHVKGHSGNPGNEHVDVLATIALQQ